MARKYIIQKGDTLSRIARKLNIDMDLLAKMNAIKNKDRIVVTVVGGVVQSIHSNNPNIKVDLFDYDIFDYEAKNEKNKTKKQQQNLEDKLIKNMNEIY